MMIKLIVVQSTVKAKIGEWKKNIGKWHNLACYYFMLIRPLKLWSPYDFNFSS